MTRIGVVGAGRVGAVLSAALRSAGHEIVAAAGESDASLHRIETLLPGVPPRQADRRRACLRPAAAHRARRHARERRHQLVGAGAIRAGQYVVHTSGRHGLAVLEPATRGRRPAGRDAPGDDLHRHRRRPRPARRLRLRHHRRRRRARVRRGASSPTSAASPMWVPEEQAHALPRRSRPRRQPPGHPGHPGDGAARAPPAPRTPPRTLRPLLTAALDNALEHGDAALTGPIVRGDVEHGPGPPRTTSPRTPRPRSRRTSPWRRPPPTGPSLDGRLLPIRAAPHRRPARRGARARRRDRSRRRRPSYLPERPAMTTRPSSRTPARSCARRSAPRRAAGRVGFVPTMGALHAGHAALMRAGAQGGRVRRARRGRRSSSTRCSSAPGEDLDRYPRTFDADLALCAAQGVDIVFAPSVDEVYPGGDPQVTVDPGPLATVLEGATRPDPLPRRAHRRRQAVRPGAARRRGVRGEGLPAAGADPPDGLRPVPGRRRRRRRRPSASPTGWRCPAATATSTPSSAGAAVALSPRAVRGP